MTKSPKRLSNTDKVKALKSHLLEKKPVSEVCDAINIAPSAYYNWQTKLFENAEYALTEPRKHQQQTSDQKRIQLLEERLQQREEALAELMTEHVKLKKSFIGLA